jgi:hypothetical protein
VKPSSQNPDRDGYIAGLRQLADWLEQHPGVEVPYVKEIGVPLRSNQRVEEFAKAAGVGITTDEAGNTDARVKFGVLTYYAYGYADWDRHLADHYETQARTWADKNGMVIEPREEEQTASFEDRVVAYRNPWRPGVLLCREHGEGWAGMEPLTSDDLPDGGTCTHGDPADPSDVCGRGVLIDNTKTGGAS